MSPYQDPLGLSETGKLPEIAEAFRATGTVCVERTLRILGKSRHDAPGVGADKIVAHVRSMGRTFQQKTKSVADANIGHASHMANMSGTLQQKRQEKVTMLKEI